MFDALPAIAVPISKGTRYADDELARYLAEPVDATVNDALAWWHSKQLVYPRLSRMARDYLSIPGASTQYDVYHSGSMY